MNDNELAQLKHDIKGDIDAFFVALDMFEEGLKGQSSLLRLIEKLKPKQGQLLKNLEKVYQLIDN